MVKSDKNPGGLPIEVFDKIREGTSNNRAQFYQDITLPFYGYNRPGAKISQGMRDNWWRQGMMGGIKAQYDCIKAFSETDFTEDLKRIDVPTLVMHGDDDQIVPFADAGPLSAKLLKNATTKFYPGFPHGHANYECRANQCRHPPIRNSISGRGRTGRLKPECGAQRRLRPGSPLLVSRGGRSV